MIDDPASAHRATTSPERIRRGVRLALLFGLAALLIASILASAAHARVPKVFFGVAQGGKISESDYRRMHDAHVKTKRLTIFWRYVEPQKGAFTWSSIDRAVSGLARHGISPAFVVYGAPAWATGSNDQAVAPIRHSAKREWRGFLKKAVKRYKRGGKFWKEHPGLPREPAKSWQIWNEPNLSKYFVKPGSKGGAKGVPKAYAKLVKASDKAIHRADKRAKVILAGLTGNPVKEKLAPQRFIKKFLRAKRIKKHFDAAALHPYAANVKEYKSRITKLRKALNKGGAKRKKIWLTEVGWGSVDNGQRLNKGLEGQARILKRSFRATLKNRKRWKIQRLIWFDWRDPPPSKPIECSFCPSAGLLRNNGSTKPSYDKFVRFAKKQGRGGHHHHHAR